MGDSNPSNLEFSWNLISRGVREKLTSNGMVSTISYTPTQQSDFGEIECIASNGVDVGVCKLTLELGGLCCFVFLKI